MNCLCVAEIAEVNTIHETHERTRKVLLVLISVFRGSFRRTMTDAQLGNHDIIH